MIFYLKYTKPTSELIKVERIAANTIGEAIVFVDERSHTQHMEPITLYADEALLHEVYHWLVLEQAIERYGLAATQSNDFDDACGLEQVVGWLKELKDLRKKFYELKEKLTGDFIK